MVVDDYYSQIHTDSSEPQQKSKKVVKKILVKKKLQDKTWAVSATLDTKDIKIAESKKEDKEARGTSVLEEDKSLNDILEKSSSSSFQVVSSSKKQEEVINTTLSSKNPKSQESSQFQWSQDTIIHTKAVKFPSEGQWVGKKQVFWKKDIIHSKISDVSTDGKSKKIRFWWWPVKKRIRDIQDIENDTFVRSHKVKHKKKEEKNIEDIEQNLKSRAWETVQIDEMLSLKEFSEKIWIPLSKLMAEFMKNGLMVNLNSQIDFDTASLIAESFDVTLEKKQSSQASLSDIVIWDITELLKEDNISKLQERPPIVSIMGHVDHWKTSLLDYIRSASIASSEAGWITQSIGAYQVEHNGKKISFLDTPGHEAFTIMRARGAKSTDIAILVVAADEWVKPQTLESISHAKVANIPVIVAINKMDKEGANPDYVKGQLAENWLMPEDWGWDTPMIPVSAHTGFWIDELLEIILLVSEMNNFQANPSRSAVGTVIESHLDTKLWPVASILINTGTLRKGDSVVCGKNFWKVKLMKDYTWVSIVQAYPWDPVLLVWLDGVVDGWDILQCVESIDIARSQAVAFWEYVSLQKKAWVSQLDLLLSKIQSGILQQLKIVLKADTNGSLEAIKNAIIKLSTPETTVSIVHAGVGNITEWDVLMCWWNSAILVWFWVQLGSNAKNALEDTKVEYIESQIIYHITERLEKIITGMYNQKEVEVLLCEARVWGIFYDSKKFKIIWLQGITEWESIENKAFIRIVRSGKVIGKGMIESLKFWVEEVQKLEGPVECGIKVSGLQDVQEKDSVEVYKIIKE